MSDELMLDLTGAQFSSTPYFLEKFDQRLVTGETYPAAFPAVNSVLPGRLYKNLSPEHFELLDAYEGDFYERIKIIGIDPFDPSGALRPVYLYIAKAQNLSRLSAERWRGS